MTSLSLPRTRRASQGSPHRPGTLARREARWGYLFIAPWLIGFLVFTLAPMIASLLFTFTNLNLDQSEPLSFVGLENWQKLLRDGQAWESLGVTFRFAACSCRWCCSCRSRWRSRSTAGTFARRACSGSCSSCRT